LQAGLSVLAQRVVPRRRPRLQLQVAAQQVGQHAVFVHPAGAMATAGRGGVVGNCCSYSCL
jgi:hypothetical protein